MASMKPLKCKDVEVRWESRTAVWGGDGHGTSVEVYLEHPHKHATLEKLGPRLKALIERHIDELVETTTTEESCERSEE